MTPAEELLQAIRFKGQDPSDLHEEMRQRCLRIEHEIQIMADDVERLERERNKLRFKCVLLEEKLEARKRTEQVFGPGCELVNPDAVEEE